MGRICKHHERLKAEYKSNPDIDPQRAGMNYHIIEPTGLYRDMVLARIEQAGARRRKDSVVLQDCFVGGTPDWLKAKSYEEQREYFNHAYQFFERNFGKENIISAVVHMDEATPHMHLCFVPITAKGRLSSKDIIGGPQGLVKWQDRFYEHMRQRYPDLFRGLPKKLTHRKHVPPYMFKLTAELYKHYDEICQAINSIGVLNSGRKKEEATPVPGVRRRAVLPPENTAQFEDKLSIGHRQILLHFELGTRELSMALLFQLFGKIGNAPNEKGNFGQY